MPVFMCNVTVSYLHPQTGEIGSANRALVQTGRSKEIVKEQFMIPLAFEMQAELGLQDEEDTFGFAFSCVKLEVEPLTEMLRIAKLDQDPVSITDDRGAPPALLN